MESNEMRFGSAFMGNRCFRYWSRNATDWTAKHLALPLSGAFLAPYLGQQSRPVIVLFGVLRAILPFAMSFQGSRFGRQLTYNTFKYANYRWQPVQSIMTFHERASVYQDTDLDPELLRLAREVAVAIGHGKDPSITRKQLANVGFHVVGAGSGGYAVYRMQRVGSVVMLHVTPYGPSILEELPRFIVLEQYIGGTNDLTGNSIRQASKPRLCHVCGYTYSGAYFQAQEWAALKVRYDRELENYSNACRIMGTTLLPAHKRNMHDTKVATPPVDLKSLKAFLRTGRHPRKQRKDNRIWKSINAEVERMASVVAQYQARNQAPPGVILYLEGLDCSGKSSTGMLISDALQRCSYSVEIAQHNRPPTSQQQMKPWMDRGRFQYPDDLYDNPNQVPPHACVVWDRGPAGDFVYGGLHMLSTDEKLKRYEEFRQYDYNCRNEGVLLCKMFFVTDRDSIAKTLGKRLAHKKIARDLRTWLSANATDESFYKGLSEIETHIDPTDFVAFNHYEENLGRFAEFVRNTDFAALPKMDPSVSGYHNPWLVVNTSDRYAARMGIMKAFQKQLKAFTTKPIRPRVEPYDALAYLFGSGPPHPSLFKVVPNDIVERREHGISLRAVLQSLLLLLLCYLYAHLIWKFDFAGAT
jgi:polyphosphate kinase 2 (PPK2 family)